MNKRIRGQSTAEYAILIGLVIAAAVAMQIYVKRALQARMHTAGRYMTQQVNIDNNPAAPEYQYEPYYIESNMDVSRNTDATANLVSGGNYIGRDTTTTSRAAGGTQQYTYDYNAARDQ